MLRISAAARLPVAKLGESSALRVGEWVIALGSPLHLSNRCGKSTCGTPEHRVWRGCLQPVSPTKGAMPPLRMVALLRCASMCSSWRSSGRDTDTNPVCGRACSVSAGIVSALERKGAELGLDSASTDYIQTDAATAAGSSGGPLVNVQVCDRSFQFAAATV